MTLRVAIYGLGDAGGLHARALVDAPAGVAWTAIAGRDDAGVAAFRARHGVPPAVRGFGSLDALLAADAADAVVIATPDHLHVAHARACLTAGRHVLVEKPLAATTAEAAALVELAAARGRGLGVGYHLRHHAGHRRLRAELDARVGAVRHVAVSWAWPDPAVDGWRARGDGGRLWSLAALGTHALDLVAWLAGPIARVAAIAEPPGGVDRAAVVSLGLASGATATVACAVTHRALSRVIVAGERGEVEAVGTLGAHGGGALWHRPAAPRGAVEPVAFTPVDPYRAQLAAFAAAVAAGAAPTDDPVGNVDLLARISAAIHQEP